MEQTDTFKKSIYPEDKQDTLMADLELSVRTRNCLDTLGLHFVYELKSYSKEDLLKLKNFGRKSLNELLEILFELKIGLKPTPAWRGLSPKEKYLKFIESIKSNRHERKRKIFVEVLSGSSCKTVGEKFNISGGRVGQVLSHFCIVLQGVVTNDYLTDKQELEKIYSALDSDIRNLRKNRKILFKYYNSLFEPEAFMKKDFAKILDVTPRTIQTYTELGLVVPEIASAAGHGSNRIYSNFNLVQLKIILHFRKLGVNLKRLKPLVHDRNIMSSKYVLIPWTEGDYHPVFFEEDESLQKYSVSCKSCVILNLLELRNTNE